ncbi:unnamed protein product [Brugia timori]|uniref:Uncharacterized protein n=1 Tax=Brugia timori TaxID=42155 RepID=A0A0R3QLP6_9BILA|nr:unnamed protein product [Brugia timori]
MGKKNSYSSIVKLLCFNKYENQHFLPTFELNLKI